MTVEQNSRCQQSNMDTQHHFRMRPFEVSEADIIAQWYHQVEDVSIFDRQVPVPINHAEVDQLVKSLVTDQSNGKCRWFLIEANDGEAVGMVALEAINMLHGHAILPVFIAEPWRRYGIGIRCAGMMIDLAFKQLRLNRVTTVYRSDNAASSMMISRLGFKHEGTSRQAWFSQGQYYDLINVGLLAGEWERIRPTLRAELNPSVNVELGPIPSQLWSWPGSANNKDDQIQTGQTR